jgi:uncharacterized membrane protein YqjE
VSQLASESSGLIRDEIQLAKREMSEKMGSLRAGITLIVIAIALGLPAILTLVAAAVIGLAHYMSLGYSALVMGGALFLVASIFALVGVGKIKQTNLKPEQTIATLQEDKEWLKELT